MKGRDLIPILTSVVFLLAGLLSTAKAQQPRGPVELPSVAHATSPSLRSMGIAKQRKPFGATRVIPLLRPEKAGAAVKGGSGAVSAPSAGGNWSDTDLQTSYNSSLLTVGKVFAGGSFSGAIPPDENLSVGINSTGTNPQTQIVQVINTNYNIYDASGNTIASGDLAGNLFANMTNSVCSSEDGGDPIALFDKLDSRWIISQLAYNSTFTDNHLCLAISQTSDAAGSYNLYDISFNSNLPDYPKLAVWADGIYFSANIFVTQGSTQQFVGAQACSFPRSDVTNPPSSGKITFSCSPGTNAAIYNILPADLENPPGTATLPSGSDYYMQFVDDLSPSSGDMLALYRFDPSTGSLNSLSTLTVNTFYEACGGGTCIPQAGTTQQLDSLGDRLMYRLSFRAYSNYDQIVVNHAVQINSSSQQSGIRWYVIRSDQGGPFYIDKESTFSPDSTYYRWMGSIAQNKYGDLGLGYSVSGVTGVPGIAVTGLLNGTDNLMEEPQRMYNGNDQSYQGTYNRWGDYSSISVDPSDDCTFWYTNEYVTPPVLSFDFLWQTEIGSFKFGDCSGSILDSFALSTNPPSQTVIAGTIGTTYSVSVTPTSGYQGIVNLTVPSGCPDSPSNCSISPTYADFSSSSTPVNATLTVNTSTSTPAQNYNIVVKGTDSQNGNIASQISVQLAVTDFSLSSNPASQTVTAGTAATYTIAANALNGFSGTISPLSVSNCPSPLTCSLGSTSLNAGSSTTLTVSGTSSVTTTTSFSITVTGTSSGLTRSVTAGLTVSAATGGNFSLSVNPPSQTVPAGTGTTYTVSVSPSGGFSGTVGFSVSGLPNGAFASFNPTSVNGSPTWQSTMTITTSSSSTPAGNYTLTITGTGGGLTSQTSVQLAVTDFSLSSNPPSQTVTAGTNATYTITANSLNGFSGSVGLSVTNCPSPLTCNLGSLSISAGSSTNLTVSGTSSVTTSTSFNITVTGTSSGLTRSVTAGLTINPPPSGGFSLSASPGNLTLKTGQSGSYTVTVTPSGGFTGNVDLSVTNCPSGVTCGTATVTITGTSAASGLLTITDNSAPRNNTTLNIMGISETYPGLTSSVSGSLRTH